MRILCIACCHNYVHGDPVLVIHVQGWRRLPKFGAAKYVCYRDIVICVATPSNIVNLCGEKLYGVIVKVLGPLPPCMLSWSDSLTGCKL